MIVAGEGELKRQAAQVEMGLPLEQETVEEVSDSEVPSGGSMFIDCLQVDPDELEFEASE